MQTLNKPRDLLPYCHQLAQRYQETSTITCIEPSPMPPAMHFPSQSQVHVVTGTLPGLASFGLMTYTSNN